MGARIAALTGGASVSPAATTFTITYAATPRIGDLIVLGIACAAGLTISITDNASTPNTYTSRTTLTNDTVLGAQMFSVQIANVTSLTTFTVTFSASSSVGYQYDYQGYIGGVASGDPRDPASANGAHSATGASGTTASSGATATATAVPNDILVGFVTSSQGFAVTQPANWTEAAGTIGHSLGDRLINTSGTAYSFAPTMAGSAPWDSHIVAFYAIPIPPLLLVSTRLLQVR